ncbi:MAG: hypothetical protein AB7N70_15205 [Dehalococcoidia bacterium]
MTVRMGVVIAMLAVAGLIAGMMLFRSSRSEADEGTDRIDDTDVAISAADETVPAESESTPV